MLSDDHPTPDELNMAPAHQQQCEMISQSHNHWPALAQASEFMIGQFVMSVTSPEQHVYMMCWHNAFIWHCWLQAGGLLIGTSHTGRKQRCHMGLMNGTVKQSCSVKGCMVGMFCGAMLLQGHVSLNMASV